MSIRHDSKKEKLYQEIVDYKRAIDGCSPSIRDLKELAGIPSHSTVYLMLKELEAEGYIIMGHDKYSRSIQVVGGVWELD